ncbi:MAG: hypothetical protein ACRCVX_11520, partial [Shewanella sp.]
DSNTTRITALESVVIFLQAFIESVSIVANEAKAQAANAFLVASLAQGIAENALAEVRSLEPRVAALEVWRTVIAATVAALVAWQAVVTAALAAIEAQIVLLGKAVAILQAEVAALASVVAAIQAQLALIRLKLIDLEGDIEEVEQIALEALQLARSAYTLAIEARREAAEALEAARQAYGTAIQALSRANEAVGLIRALERLVAAIQAAIDDMLIRLASAFVRVNTLEDTLEGVIAILEEIKELLSGEISGVIDVTPCGDESDSDFTLPFEGAGLPGVFSALSTMALVMQPLFNNTKCPPSGESSLPMSWEVKPGIIPQLVVSWYEVADESSSRWTMAIPHPASFIDRDYEFAFPVYQKGNYMITYRLTDNSTVVINAASEAEGQKVLNYVTTLLDAAFKPSGGTTYSLTRINGERSQKTVRAGYIKKFEGERTEAPRWAKAINPPEQ